MSSDGFLCLHARQQTNGTLYTGMTDNLIARAWQHREGLVPGFTRDYSVKSLVWFEVHNTRYDALTRERQIKNWNRAWKIELIERANPSWNDLREELGPS
ncbi:MAG TPA: GIY-YIG nuclease family protein [Pseudolabrys sp.]|nr:GIY-YIG nuclease family protein [Pseudolabrys sp.]